MNDRYQLIAFCSTLAAICYLVTVALVAAAKGYSLEAVGVAAAVTGLIGVIRMPAARAAGVNVETAGQVGPNGPVPAPPPATDSTAA